MDSPHMFFRCYKAFNLLISISFNASAGARDSWHFGRVFQAWQGMRYTNVPVGRIRKMQYFFSGLKFEERGRKVKKPALKAGFSMR